MLGKNNNRVSRNTNGILGVALLVAMGILTGVGSEAVSALTYQSEERIFFTFNPSMSLTVSGDLNIDDLAPGMVADSNIITVTAGANSSLGYTLYANVGNADNNYTDLRLVSTDDVNKFAVLPAPVTTLNDIGGGKWGYSYCDATSSAANCNTDSNWVYGSTGSTNTGYGIMPLYNNVSHATDVKIADTSSADATTVKFKIGAKSADSQAAGAYTNVINFIGIPKIQTVDYTLNYVDRSGTVSSSTMPSPNPQTGTTTGDTFTISNATPINTNTNLAFMGWCTADNASDPMGCSGTIIHPGSMYVIANPSAIWSGSVYAVWSRASYNITVNFAGSGVNTVTLTNSTYGGGGTVTTSGGTVSLKHGVAYNISGTYNSGYEFSSWATAANGTLGSTSAASTTYTVTGTSTLTLTGKSCTAFPTNTAMQSFAGGNYCVNSGTLVDNRDNTTYHVAKLDDGKWWMLDNLALDLVAKKSVLTQDNTHASNTTLNYLKNGGGSTSDKYATAAVANWTSSYSYSAPLVNISNKDVIPSDSMSQAGQWKVGGYYNYCAASAGSYCYGNGTSGGTSSGNATEDICPKGWRMPTGNTSGEYQALYNNASYNTYANYRSALRLPLSGRFYNGSASGQGSSGIFWSSTRGLNNSMYDLYLTTSNVTPSSNGRRDNGYSIRCLLSS